MFRQVRAIGAVKTPIIARCLIGALVLATGPRVFGALGVNHSGALTEADAVLLGLSRPGVDEMLSGEVDLARSDAVKAGLMPNPIAAYAREQTFGGADASAEDYAWLLQKFDLSGRRGLRSEAAQRRVEATEDQVRNRRLTLGARIRTRFYDVLQRQGRAAALRQWCERLAIVADRIARRAAAGDAAQYDRQRAEREHAGAVARLSVDEAGLARAREQLAALLGDQPPTPGTPIVVGDLLPATPPPALDAVLDQLPARPDLRALEATAGAAELQGRASARWWLPEIEIGAGLKSVEVGGERLNGFIASGAIPLPLLNRNQDEAMRAAAEAQVARGRRRVELAEAAGEVRGVHAQATRLADSARRARSESDREWRTLARSAEAAYHGGEAGILELVDAYRAQLDAEMQTLDLEWRARRARIELDRLTGADRR
jgi:outer membrane protein, heavy metal efflux system